MILTQRRSRRASADPDRRLPFLMWSFVLVAVLMVVRLAYLQIVEYGLYALYASDQHELASKLLPTRGQVFVRDRGDGALHPLATNRLAWQVYAVPKEMTDPVTEAHALSAALQLPDVDVVTRLTKRADDPYELLAKDVPSDVVNALTAQNLDGIGFVKSTARLYPEKGLSGQLIGFVSPGPDGTATGKYGIEGSFEKELAGTPGKLQAEKDASGRRLIIGQTELEEAVNGSDLVLTIDRSIQYHACDLIQKAVVKHQADSGSIVILDPQTGAVLAMCSSPDFDPSSYGQVKDLGVLNNPITLNAFEPGSVFKALTMAAGLDANKITPKSTYVDTGVEEIDNFKIHNSDLLAHGVQSMTQVLDESLNTGAIFVQRQLGKPLFKDYMDAFGFGKRTNVGLTPEGKGDSSPLLKKGDVFAATTSYGQGITATPLQVAVAYAALANGGKLLRPYIVDEIIHPDGTREKTKPEVVANPISSRASRLISGMLVSVVENGHGKKASVPGYWVAGKTGTAQVPSSNGTGYLKDVTIGSFAGYAPSSDPKFVMFVKLDHPRDVQWAESSAAPLFGEMAKFLLDYFQVPPERPITTPPPSPTLPLFNATPSSTVPTAPTTSTHP